MPHPVMAFREEFYLLTGVGDRLRTCVNMSTCGTFPSCYCHQYVNMAALPYDCTAHLFLAARVGVKSTLES